MLRKKKFNLVLLLLPKPMERVYTNELDMRRVDLRLILALDKFVLLFFGPNTPVMESPLEMGCVPLLS